MLGLTINNYELIYLPWNIFLLLIPFFICYLMWKIYLLPTFTTQKFFLFFLFFLWLLFVPNTAYVILDSRHMINECFLTDKHLCPQNSWHILFFFLYGLIGWLGLVYAIRQMKFFLNKIFSQRMNLFPLVLMPILSFGVLLGLIGRLNSWDVFFNHQELFSFLQNFAISQIFIKNFFIFTFLLYVFYYLGDFVLQPFNFLKQK